MVKVKHTEVDIVPGRLWRYVKRNEIDSEDQLFNAELRRGQGTLYLKSVDSDDSSWFSYETELFNKTFRIHKTPEQVRILRVKALLESRQKNVDVLEKFKELLIELEI